MQRRACCWCFPGLSSAGAGPTGRASSRSWSSCSPSCAGPATTTDVLDLEAELGNPADDVARESFLQIADGLLAEREADLVVVSCWSALQYSAAAGRRRACPPAAPGRGDRRVRPPRLGAPGRLQRSGRALRLAHRRRGGGRGAHAGGAGGGRRARDGRLPLARGHAAAARRGPPARLRGVPVHGRGAAGARPLPQPRLPVQRAGVPAAPRRRRLARVPAGRRRRGRRRRRRAAPGQGAGARSGVRLRGRLAARRAGPAGGRRPARPRAQRHRPARRPPASGRRQALPGPGAARPRGGHALAGAARAHRPGAVSAEGRRTRHGAAGVPERQGRAPRALASSSTSPARPRSRPRRRWTRSSASSWASPTRRSPSTRSRGRTCRSAKRGPTSTLRRRASARASSTPSGGRSGSTLTPPLRRSSRAAS